MTMLKKAAQTAGALFALSLTMGANQGGCGQGLDNRPGDPGIDVGGAAGAKWAVSYGTTMEVTVKGAAGVVNKYTLPMGAGGTFEVAGVKVDLKEMCARGEVACPQDVFPAEVTMTQPGQDLHFLYVNFNRKGPLMTAQPTTLVGNVDSDDDFSIALGVTGATTGNCGLLGVSYATGHIQADLLKATRGVALSGDIVTAYSGACAAGNQAGAAAAGLTVEFRLPLTALRKS